MYVQSNNAECNAELMFDALWCMVHRRDDAMSDTPCGQ